MKIKITRTTVANKQFVLAGQVYDLPDADARLLVQLGKAEAVDGVEQPAPVEMTTETSEAVIETGAPKRKGRNRGTR